MTIKKTFYIASKLILSLILVGLASCGNNNEMNDYIQTVQSGIKTLSWPKQMETLFGDGDHFITHYGFDSDPKQWNTEVFFAGRYTLTLQVDVIIDYNRHLVKTNVSSPKFYLNEVGTILRGSKGIEGADIAGQWVLDESKWEKLTQSKGDWSAIGVVVKTNNPIPGFNEYVQGLRSPRVQVPH